MEGDLGVLINNETALMCLHEAVKGNDGPSQWRLAVAHQGGEMAWLELDIMVDNL